MKEQEKIKLFGSRDFAGNFDMSLKFIKQNFFPIAKGIAYLIPLFLIGSYFIPNIFKLYYHLGGNVNNPNAANLVFEDFSPLGVFVGYILFGGAMLAIALYTISYMALYVKSEDGVVNSSDVWKKVTGAILPILGASILFGILVLIGSVLCYIPGIMVAVYLGFYIYVYINEDLGIIDSFKRSYELVQNNFWITLGFSIVFSFLIGMVAMVFTAPFYVGMIASMLQVEFFANDIVFIIFVFIAIIGYTFLYPAFYMAMGVMYYSHRNKLENLDLNTEIDNIGSYNNGQNPPY
ncbi:hypothetical protein M2451_000020 [Dysgonomonas sp. PFB1-18]|uniref:hypothetical protein n=1 Tax=unclassified Dysgonomonas TaxID=2630389 RepID=UPI00247651FD|nr:MULTISPECIES: hypothetical protein [unclassified Dysgonomonas]MDL2303381.1 hypothetical protein [Dysgonomonas sp. OttesenSCG-928-D17]MDH6307570.1 hypothetical protein [Dysgonomonas sp. PF1-14]MDH6337488.1 hypothetical protein [Dysgonomonas sp. PF1-16]MDH6378713.1 hypothetical protein [Dysgonomonas sp. PFB1-18]MDH6399131.1 hypothetical protein [Dysgonomonas sp. PF1-23]